MSGQKLYAQVVGAGLAGSEAAFFLANCGIEVTLFEMRPVVSTPAHKTSAAAELVCSNSLKSEAEDSAPGALKREMKRMGSLVLRCAEATAVPGGMALTVDRDAFSQKMTNALESHPKIRMIREEKAAPDPDVPTILATGPLTSASLFSWLESAASEAGLYFYDAIAPIVDAQTIDLGRCFLANRYGKGDEDAYLNCPLTEAEYHAFVAALINAEKVPGKPFEEEKYFQGCQPIEAIASKGLESLRFGPMKPVGLTDPVSGSRPYAVVQLRPENLAKTAYNLVGFQTKLKYGEQTRILRMIPALHAAEFFRLGSIHRNTYVDAPRTLRPDLSLRSYPRVYLAGQITGVEGYVESAACGLLAACFLHQRLTGRPHQPPPANTAMGALLQYIVGNSAKEYQPTNIHFGLFDPTLFEGSAGLKKDLLRGYLARSAVHNFGRWWEATYPAGGSARWSQPFLA